MVRPLTTSIDKTPLRGAEVGRIQDRATTAALLALNRAVDALCESEAGARSSIAAKLLRAYAEQTANVTKAIVDRAQVISSQKPQILRSRQTPIRREAEPT